MGGFIDMVDALAKEVEKEKMKVIEGTCTVIYDYLFISGCLKNAVSLVIYLSSKSITWWII